MISLAMSVVFWVVDKARGDRLFKAGERFLTQTLPAWTSEPVGLLWFTLFSLLAMLVAACIISAFAMAIWQHWPKRQSKPRPLTREEDHLLQPHREMWNLYGLPAVESMESIFGDVAYELREKHLYWADLLTPLVYNLKRAKDEMTKAIADDTTLRIDAVRVQFDTMYEAYFQAIGWVARTNEHEKSLAEEHHERRYRAWQDLHCVFQKRITKLLQIPEHRGSLRIGRGNLKFEDQVTHRFLMAAEKSCGPQ